MELYISFKLDENGHISENPKLSIFSYNEIPVCITENTRPT